MRKITEKIAIIAQVCITLIFVVTTILYIMGLIPYNEGLRDNGVFVTLLVLLATIYGLLSAYIIYVNFSESEYLRQILLFCDSESATHANVKVIRNIVRSCAKKVKGIRVRKTKMRLDEKQGFGITIKLDANTHKVSESVDKLRCLIADAFKNTLGLTFNSINFVIRRLKSSYKPDVEKAEKLAKTLTQQRELSADIYEQPFQDNCEACKKADDNMNSNAETSDIEVVDSIREQLHENGQNATFDSEQSSLDERVDEDVE
ncbi:MAG: hypothetical protein J1G02_01915 [Clostridiales bacterium]|nr:hypothetical protein [Clostridiales bacterium]